MQGYNKGSLGPLEPVLFNAYVEASKQGYSKDSLGPLISVHFIG
jgi:hypothetical protein